ncbi:MAG: ABC transporter ATP-binding protein, partial [Acidimicrobiia bacterium]
LDLTIERGEFIALLGPSGCGKSTALNCLAGLLPLTAGSIWQDDRRIDTLPPEKRGFGMVFQNYALFPHLTVRDNIAYGRRRRRLPKDEVRRRTTAAIEMVRLEDHASKLPTQLSGGQQQRVFIARALLRRPDLLLMDEPTAGVDVATRHEVLHLLDELHADGMAILLTTHDLNGVAAHLPKLVCLNTEVMAAGEPGKVLTPEVLERTYGAPMDVLEHAGMPFVVDRYEPGRVVRFHRRGTGA